MQENSEQEPRFLFGLLAVIIVVCLVVVSSIVLSTPQETYTKLYFDSLLLPAEATEEDSFRIAFNVENREGEEMDYSFKIEADGEYISGGRLMLGNGELRLVERQVSLPAGQNQKLEIVLLNSRNEQYNIFFWIDVEAKA